MNLLCFLLLLMNGGGRSDGFSISSLFSKMEEGFQAQMDSLKMEGRRDLDKFERFLDDIGSTVENHLMPSIERVDDLVDGELSSKDDLNVYDPFHAGLSLPPASGPGITGTLNRMMTNLERLNPIKGLMGLFGGNTNWWEGDNVCLVVDETEEKAEETNRQFSFEFSYHTTDLFSGDEYRKEHSERCYDMGEARECKTKTTENGETKTITKRWSCCHGAMKNKQDGTCRQVVTRDLEETVRDLSGLEFLAILQEENLLAKLRDNTTLFLPTDVALEEYADAEAKLNGLDSGMEYTVANYHTYRRRKRELTIVEPVDMKEILLAHFVPGLIRSDQIVNNQVIETESSEGRVKMSVYSTPRPGEKVVMANCAKIISKDNMATNGIVHIVDRVIVPATSTIADILSGDSQFRSLLAALESSGLLASLANPGTQFTIFAPTDAAFQRLEENLRNKMLSGDLCAQDIIRNHLLSNTLCSSVIEDKAKTRNLLGKYLMLERTDDQLKVNGKQLIVRDMMATNGVIHVVDDLIIPENYRNVPETVAGMSSFMGDVLQKSGLSEELSKLSNFTLLLPTPEALSQLPGNYASDLLNDKERLREFFSYHVIYPRVSQLSGFPVEDEMTSMLDDTKVLVNSYSTLLGKKKPTVQCANVKNIQAETGEVCGVSAYTVDKVLLPPHGSLLEVLRISPEFSNFYELVTLAEMEEELESDSRTLLAPTNDAFDKLDDEMKITLKEDTNKTQEIVRRHIVPHILCCTGIQNQASILGTDETETLGETISVRKSVGGHLSAENGGISKCDIMATNGVLHYTDTLFLEARPRRNPAQTLLNLLSSR